MIKKLQIAFITVIVLMLLIVSCAPKPTAAPPVVVEEKKPPVVAPKVVPTTGEASVDEVATDISDTSDIDEELDTSELEDVDSILSDIINI